MTGTGREIVIHEGLDDDGNACTWATCTCGAIWDADSDGPLGNARYRDGTDAVTLTEWSAHHVCLDDTTQERFRDLVLEAHRVTSELMPAVATKVARFCKTSLKVGFASIHGSQLVIDDLDRFEQWMSTLVELLERLDDHLALDEPAGPHLHIVQDTTDPATPG